MRAELIAPHVQHFFREFLVGQRNVSHNTVAGYRDSIKLLLVFAAARAGREVTQLVIDDIGPDTVLAFLDHLERDRGCTAATRNTRLAAIRGLFRYIARDQPAVVDLCRRVAEIPPKKRDIVPPTYLERDEMKAFLASVDRSTSLGRRDYALLCLMYDTGARVQEVADLRVDSLRLFPPEQVRLLGKGRKERLCPISPETAALLDAHLKERGVAARGEESVFVNRLGTRLNRAGIARRVVCYARAAADRVPALANRRVSPHTLRHTTAMHMLQSGADLRVISAILGHASMVTTHHYTRIDLAMKRKALEIATQANADLKPGKSPRWRREPDLLEWLERL